jgi:hypothetical protein
MALVAANEVRGVVGAVHNRFAIRRKSRRRWFVPIATHTPKIDEFVPLRVSRTAVVGAHGRRGPHVRRSRRRAGRVAPFHVGATLPSSAPRPSRRSARCSRKPPSAANGRPPWHQGERHHGSAHLCRHRPARVQAPAVVLDEKSPTYAPPTFTPVTPAELLSAAGDE